MKDQNDLENRRADNNRTNSNRPNTNRPHNSGTNPNRPNTGRPNTSRRPQENKAVKKKRKKRRVVIVIIEILVLLILLAALYMWNKANKIQRVSINEKDVSINKMDDTAKKVLSGYTNIALFGLDNRSNGKLDSGNSDTIMVASINNDTKEVRLVSIYRDSYLNLGDDSYSKANAAYAKGGPKQAIRMLNQNLDLDIKNYVTVDFNALVNAVDAVGGIQIPVTDDEVKVMNGQTGHEDYIAEIEKVTGKKSIHLKKGGTYNLDGVQATAYCRLRYLAGDDYMRAQRQRTVLSALIAKAKKSDITQLDKLIDGMMDKISTSFSNTDIISLVSQMKDYNLVSVPGFPYDKNTKDMGGNVGDAVIPCDLSANVIELHKQLFAEKSYTPSSTVRSISNKIVSKSGYSAKNAIKTSDPTEGSTTSSSTDSTTQQTTEISNNTTTGTTNSKSTTGTTNSKSTTGTTNSKSTTGTTSKK